MAEEKTYAAETYVFEAEQWRDDIIAASRCDDTSVTMLRIFVDVERQRRARSHHSVEDDFPFAKLRVINAQVTKVLREFGLWPQISLDSLEEQLVMYEKWRADNIAKARMKAEEDAHRKKIEADHARADANLLAFMASFVKVFLVWVMLAFTHYCLRGSPGNGDEYVALVVVGTLVSTASWLITPAWITE